MTDHRQNRGKMKELSLVHVSVVHYPGLPREKKLDARACDQWKKETLFSLPPGTHLRNLLGGLPLWSENGAIFSSPC